MSPRAKKATDEEVFGAVLGALSRLGPERMTLADVAREVGVTAGALVQRFGSKRDLLLAAVRHFNRPAEGTSPGPRPASARPLEALGEYATCAAAAFRTPEEVANQLGMLQLDITDPEFRAEAVRFFEGERGMLREWLEAAVAAGDLAPEADPALLARAIQSLLNGARLLWPILREGSPEDAIRAELEALLGRWRRG